VSGFTLFYSYYGGPYRVVATAEGGLRGYRLNSHLGELEIANSLLEDVLFEHEYEIVMVHEAEFVDLAEQRRAQYLRGDGPIFQIYRAVDDALSDRDHTLAALLRRRTFALWAEELRCRDEGLPASFEYESVTGRDPDDLRRFDAEPDLVHTAPSWMRELEPWRAAHAEDFWDSPRGRRKAHLRGWEAITDSDELARLGARYEEITGEKPPARTAAPGDTRVGDPARRRAYYLETREHVLPLAARTPGLAELFAEWDRNFRYLADDPGTS
jgi:hypothetical protein